MKNWLFLLFFCFALSASAQSNFKHGYIISNENDTIKGFIDFRTSHMNSKSCKFKQDEKGEVKIYYPGEIKGYRFTDEGKLYVSRDIEINGKKELIFLEYLLQGIMNLYYYVDNREYYFLEDSTGKMVVIDKKDDEYKYDEKGSTTFIKPDQQYIGMLKYIFQGSNSATSQVDKMKYTTEDIINITKMYHNDVCTTGEECIVFETKKDKHYTEKKFSVYVGIQDYTLKLKQTGDGVLQRVNNIRSAFPVIGAQLNLSIPRWIKSLSLQFDVAFSGINGEADSKGVEIYSYYTFYEYKTLLSTNKIGAKYTHLSGKFRPSIEAGMSSIFLFASSSTYGLRYYDKPDFIGNSRKDDIFPEGPFIGYYAAIGLDYMLPDNKSLIARIGYENHSSMASYVENSGPQISAFSFKIGYGF